MGAAPTKPEEDKAKLQDKIAEKGGKPMDRDGDMALVPWEKRGCTDMLMLLIFLISLGGMLAVGIVGFVSGNPARLHYGYDFNGHVCGWGVNEGKENLYYPYPFPPIDPLTGSVDDPTDVDLTWAVCVEECPNMVDVFPPNQCMLPYKSETRSGGIVTCGGLPKGMTNMDQFAATASLPTSPVSDVGSNVGSGPTVLYADTNIGALGYQTYCMDRVPVCEPCNDETCCDGTNQVAARTRDISEANNGTEPYANQVLFGVSLGRRYGYCYVPIPTVKASFSTRCFPVSGDQAGKDNVQTLDQGLKSFSNETTSTQEKNEQMQGASQVVALSLGSPQDTFSSLVDEVQTNFWVIVGCAGVALLVALAYTQILRVAALPLTIAVLALLWALLGLSTAVLGIKAGFIDSSQVPAKLADGVDNLTLPDGVELGSAATNQHLLIGAAVLVGGTFLVYSVLLLVMASRIYLATQVIQEAAKCLAEIPSALFFPIFQWLAMIALFTWWIIVFLFLASAGDWDPVTHTYNWNDDIRRSAIFHFFMLLWVRAFILAVGNLVIAGATCDWFIIHDKKTLKFPVWNALLRTLRFHTGTAAAGSLIIAIVQFIRWAFRYYMYQLSKLNPNNQIVKLLTCIGDCCLACIERFLKFVNRNAYIQTALASTSFCESAQTAMLLLVRNCLRVGALAVVATIFNNIGKLFIAVVTGLIGALIIMGGDFQNVANAPVFSVTLIIILAFGIASAFIDVWDVVIETLFQCFCMDIEKGSGKTDPAFNSFVDANEGKNASAKEISSQI